MNRRSFLKSIGAAGILPALPIPSFAISTTAATPAVSAHTYQWAEMIVRAHNKCNLGLLQRSLQVNETVASALKSRLIENGVVSAQANAYGIHTAVKPLYEGAFMNVSDTTEQVAEAIADYVDGTQEEEAEIAENESDFSNLQEADESESEAFQTEASEDEEVIISDVAEENQS